MLGIIVFLVALLAMFAWFGYLIAKDPANLFKRNQRRRDANGDDVIVGPLDVGREERSPSDSFTPGGGDFGGAGSSGEWDDARGTRASGNVGDDGSGD